MQFDTLKMDEKMGREGVVFSKGGSRYDQLLIWSDILERNGGCC